MFNINQWCAHQDPREYLSTPFNFNEYTMACNGNAIVAVPQVDGHPDIKDSLKENIENLLNTNGLEFEKLPADITLPELTRCKKCKGSTRISIEKCKECEGEGEVSFENDHNSYECHCKGCDGDGELVHAGSGDFCDNCLGYGDTYDRSAYIEICNVIIDAKIARLLLEIDNLEVSGVDRKLYFQSASAKGVILGRSQ